MADEEGNPQRRRVGLDDIDSVRTDQARCVGDQADGDSVPGPDRRRADAHTYGRRDVLAHRKSGTVSASHATFASVIGISPV